MASEKYTNSASTTLSAAITLTSATTLTVTSATGFPTAGNFRILIDSEILIVTSVSGTTYTVTRGAESTTAATHSNGAVVTHILTAGALDAIRTDICVEDTIANRPSASKAGNLYFHDDDVILSRDTGSAWNNFGLCYRLKPPPSSGSWTSLNSPQSLVDTNSGLYLKNTGSATANLRGYYKAAPTVPYIIECCFLYNIPTKNNVLAGFLWYESSSGKSVLTGIFVDQVANTTNNAYLVTQKYTNNTTVSAAYNWASGTAQLGVHAFMQGLIFMKMADDNSNRTVSISADGQNYNQVFSVSRTDFITANNVGFAMDQSHTTWNSGMTLIHWYEH